MDSAVADKAHCVIQSAGYQDNYNQQMQDYQKSLVRFSECMLPVMVNISNFPQESDSLSAHCCPISARATIEALKNLQAKIQGDIATLERETRQPNQTLFQVVTDCHGFSKAIVSFHASPRAERLSTETSALPRHSHTKPPKLEMNGPSTGVPILIKTPLKVETPQFDNTMDRFDSYQTVPSPIASSTSTNSKNKHPSEAHEYVFNETGTLCGGDLESIGVTEHESGCSENEVTKKYTKQSKRKQKPIVKAEHVQKNLLYTPIHSETKSKRQRAPADRYNPDNVKRIKEEGVYLSSDKLVKEAGAPIRADQEAFLNLRHCYGKQWKRVQGLGKYRDQEVVINPNGVEYRLKNNPKVGKDFFASAQDALMFCIEHCTPINPLPDQSDIAPVADPAPTFATEMTDPGNSVLNGYWKGNSSSSDENDVSSFDGNYLQ